MAGKLQLSSAAIRYPGADLENLQGRCTLAGQLASMHVINVNTKVSSRLETQGGTLPL